MVDAENVSALSDALIEEGALCVDLADAAAGTERETPIFGEPGNERGLTFGLNRVVALFSATVDVGGALARAASQAGLGASPGYRISQIADRDWVRLTQSQFAPIRVSSRLWIVPSWHALPDPNAINIILDPGLAFGTGSHPTTRLCLDWLEEHLVPGSSVIDYGCGSGILAIAAAKLGAARVQGVDIDDQAVLSSRENARRNGVAADFAHVNEAALAPAQIVLANILSNPLKALAPLLARLTMPGGRLVLSGLLSTQSAEVSETYRPWFEIESSAVDEGWARLSAIRTN